MAKAPRYDGVTAEMPLPDAARRIVRALVAEVAADVPAVLAAGDVRAVHDLRVALRRLRSAAAAFANCFPKKRWNAFRRDARRLARRLGDVRDADVHLAALRGALGGAAAAERPGIAFALETLVERRRSSLAAFAIELSQFEREAATDMLADG